MQEKVNQFEKNNVWKFVSEANSVIETLLNLSNKLDVFGNFLENKIRLVTKGYYQQEDINSDETYVICHILIFPLNQLVDSFIEHLHHLHIMKYTSLGLFPKKSTIIKFWFY